jgi:hypothetical protein
MAGPGGELPQQGGARAGQRHQLAVDHHRVAPHVQHVARHGQRYPPAERNLLDDLPDQGTQSRALGLDHRDSLLLERASGDRANAGGHDRPAQCRPHAVAASLLAGGAQEASGRGRARERDRIDGGAAHGLDQPVEWGGVLRQHPAVDRHLDHLGPGHPQRLHRVWQRLSMQLDRDSLAVQVAGDQVLQDLTGGLRLRGPGLPQASGANGAACLRPAGQHGSVPDGLDELLANAPRIGGLDPAAKPDARGRDDDVQRRFQATSCRIAQIAVVGERHDPDRGRGDHSRAPAFQRDSELFPAPGGRDADRVAGERLNTHGCQPPPRCLPPPGHPARARRRRGRRWPRHQGRVRCAGRRPACAVGTRQ